MRPEAKGEADIERGGEPDQRQAFEQRQRKAQAPIDEKYADGLPDHRQPAQDHQGLQAQGAPARGQWQLGQGLVRHAAHSKAFNCGA